MARKKKQAVNFRTSINQKMAEALHKTLIPTNKIF